MIRKVCRLNGEVINIDDWDERSSPIPDGVEINDEECVIGWDGGVYVKDDPRAFR